MSSAFDSAVHIFAPFAIESVLSGKAKSLKELYGIIIPLVETLPQFEPIRNNPEYMQRLKAFDENAPTKSPIVRYDSDGNTLPKDMSGINAIYENARMQYMRLGERNADGTLKRTHIKPNMVSPTTGQSIMEMVAEHKSTVGTFPKMTDKRAYGYGTVTEQKPTFHTGLNAIFAHLAETESKAKTKKSKANKTVSSLPTTKKSKAKRK